MPNDTVNHPDVELPPGAVVVKDWATVEWTLPEYRQARMFECARHSSATEPDGKLVEVLVSGYQAADGAVDDVAVTINGNITLDAANAQRLIADVGTTVEEMQALLDVRSSDEH